MTWLQALKKHIEQTNQAYVSMQRCGFVRDEEKQCLSRKRRALHSRGAKVVKSTVEGRIVRTQKVDGQREVDYVVHFSHLIKQKNKFYLEEKIEERRAVIKQGEIIDDYCLENELQLAESKMETLDRERVTEEHRFSYSRLEAVKYAERWWNDYNPQYKKFENNCTNFVSQCLRAGNAPMTGYSNRNKGWWYQNNNWSFSWAVAHSLRWYLSGSQTGLRAKEVSKPEELMKGDVICYDFNGDGRWQHTTIVVAKDENKMPLVNAQTTNSRMRYWEYTDSTAWTENIKYKFFHIIE